MERDPHPLDAHARPPGLQGGASVTVDGQPLDFASTLTYRGVMFGGVPNAINLTGYVNASWTLKIDLCALLPLGPQH